MWRPWPIIWSATRPIWRRCASEPAAPFLVEMRPLLRVGSNHGQVDLVWYPVLLMHVPQRDQVAVRFAAGVRRFNSHDQNSYPNCSISGAKRSATAFVRNLSHESGDLFFQC